MLNIVELESQWKHYKLKSFLPYIILTVLFLIAITVILFLTLTNKKLLEKNIVELEEQDKKVEVIEEVMEETVRPEVEKLIISPSFNFIQEIKNEPKTPTIEQRPTPKPEKVEIKKPPVQKSPPKQAEKVLKQVVKTKAIEKKQTSISISRKNTIDDINDVIKRFNKNNNPALSLFVAKKYYELSEYKKSYNYALITNEINNDIESSWIIFAKSLVKLGQKNKAIKVLNKYISHSNSNRASMLRDKIASGKFR